MSCWIRTRAFHRATSAVKTGLASRASERGPAYAEPPGVSRPSTRIRDPRLRRLAEALSALPHFEPDLAWKARLKARLMMLEVTEAAGATRREPVDGPLKNRRL